jgi:hypothetical protein
MTTLRRLPAVRAVDDRLAIHPFLGRMQLKSSRVPWAGPLRDERVWAGDDREFDDDACEAECRGRVSGQATSESMESATFEADRA